MKYRQHLALQYSSKVDQHVTATDEVQLGKRWIARQVVPCKNAYVTDALGDLVTPFRSGEESRPPLRRNRGQSRLRVYACAGFFDCRFADIGGENLEWNRYCRVVQEFRQTHGNRIRFLPRSAPRHPDPD